MAVPMKNGGMNPIRVVFYVILSEITTGVIGAIFVIYIRSIMPFYLAFAAGAMIYVVSGELTPEANKLYSGRMTAIGNICGLLLGIIALNIT